MSARPGSAAPTLAEVARDARRGAASRAEPAGGPAPDAAAPAPRGCLVAVVGPSGAGKDTLLSAARDALAGDPRFLFLRRCITRPAEAGGEEHQPLSREAFLAAREAGQFALWWEAHGLFYGIPRAMEAELAAGRVTVANLSRRVLAEAATRLPLHVLDITAPPDLLAARLRGRGREDAADIARRLAREAPLPAGLPVTRVLNNGSPAEGAARVLAALREAADRLAAPA
ncbi:phosphonate metabolism protein/1,5-bisphosphokinase (PRPP-forming) PhnN [Roseomonas sp. BN140053]|uniref:phosphonate metabolism protein/1,5-bisphosphokinase (PRPP-forming) PhnN n=1 Tax=Roseomonas sp. BN140053 TaxID=3391898 RepID=UPI0039E836BF